MAIINGTDGDDDLVGTNAADVINGLGGDDKLTAGAGDTLNGGDGDDRLIGAYGAILNGGAGIDTADYTGKVGMMTIDLAAGTGSFNAAQGTQFIDVENVIGGESGDRIFGNSAANHLFGNGGDDALWGGDGADILDGGAGVDTLDFAGDSGGVGVDLRLGIGTAGSAAGDSYVSIENIVGSAYDDRLTAGAGVNRLEGGGGNDWLDGGDGADVLIGGPSIGFPVPSGGRDTADYSHSTGEVWVELTGNNGNGAGHWNWAEGDVLSSIENVVGSAFDDWIYGTGSSTGDWLYGGDGNDHLFGNGGNSDELYGGNGNDTLVSTASFGVGTAFHGGAGADRLEGGGLSDLADYADSSAAVWVHLGTGQGFWNDAEGDTLITIENLRGSLGNDLLYGSDGDNVIYGNDGNDDIGGGGGSDTLIGGVGADGIDGGAGTDTIDFSGNFGAVAVSLRAGVGNWNYAEGDRYANVENVIGTSYNDYLEGDAGANTLTGGGGEDLFTFVGGFGKDTITDFVGNGAASGDRISFGAGIFTGFDDMKAHSTQVRLDPTHTNVVIQFDAANTVTLIGATLDSLHSSDFVFY